MNKIIRISLLSLVIVLLIINFFIVLNIPLGGFRIFKVKSDSMNPTLKYNDFILVKKTNEINEKDIITFRVENNYLTHRVVAKVDDTIITKGDALDFNNDPITKNMIVGKMVYKFKVLTFINYFLFKPIFWLVFLLIGAIYFYLMVRKNRQ